MGVHDTKGDLTFIQLLSFVVLVINANTAVNQHRIREGFKKSVIFLTCWPAHVTCQPAHVTCQPHHVTCWPHKTLMGLEGPSGGGVTIHEKFLWSRIA